MKTLKSLSPYLLFLLSITIFSVLFYLQRHFMTSLDEYDNLTAPFLMSKGVKFYSGQFNMHFPFPYYWAKLFSPLWLPLNFSRATAIFRLSLLPIYLISFFTVFLSYKNSKNRLVFSFWILLLAIILPLYHGNLYLSDTFATIFISAIFWIIVPIILGTEKLSNYSLILLIIFISAAFWTQPFLGILFILPLFLVSKDQLITFFVTSLLINTVPIIFFGLNGQLIPFIEQAILFNSGIYSKFFPEQINQNSMMYQNLIMLFPHEISLLKNINNPIAIFQFISHLSLIFFFVFLIKNKTKKTYMLAFILLIVSTRLREIKIIPGQLFNYPIFPFVAISSSSIFILFSYFSKKSYKFLCFSFILLLFIFGEISVKPIFYQSLKSGYNYEVFWSYRQRMGEDITKLTNDNEKILIYPYDSDLYFFSKRLPYNNFIYWFPWLNADNNLKKQWLQSFSINPPALIFYGNMSYKNNPVEYASYFPNMLDNYRRVYFKCNPTNYWLSKDISRDLPNDFSFGCSTANNLLLKN